MTSEKFNFVSVLALGVLLSCSAPSIDPARMVPSGLSASATATAFTSKIRIGSVTGVGTLGAPGIAEVHPAEFKKAIELSLSRAGYLTDGPERPGFVLDAAIIEIVQRDAGPTFHVDGLVRYKLTRNDGDPIFQKIIRSETLATVGEIAEGGTAYLERVVMSNISQFIDQIRELDMAPVNVSR